MQRNRFGLYASALLALSVAGMLGAGIDSSAGAGGKTNLALTPLPLVTHLYSISEGTVGITTRRPLRLPLMIESGKPTEITLAGTTVTLGYNSPDRFALKVGGTVTSLKWDQGVPPTLAPVLAPVGLTVGNNQKYVLAFPQAVPLDKTAYVSYRSGAVMQGTLGGQGIAIYDENADGLYTQDDSIRLDNGKGDLAVFMPFSRYVSTKGGIFEIQTIAEDGTSLTYAPLSAKTGKMQGNFALEPGLEVSAVYGSKTAELNFELSTRGGPAEATVLPGDYQLLYGVVWSQARNRVAGRIVPGTGGTLTVKAGEATKVAWGRPINFEFAARLESGKITIDPGTIHLKGKGGEEYRNVIYDVLPEVVLIVDGRSISLGKMAFG